MTPNKPVGEKNEQQRFEEEFCFFDKRHNKWLFNPQTAFAENFVSFLLSSNNRVLQAYKEELGKGIEQKKLKPDIENPNSLDREEIAYNLALSDIGLESAINKIKDVYPNYKVVEGDLLELISLQAGENK